VRGNLDYQIAQIWKKIDGIGTSKAVFRSASSHKNVNDTLPVSDKVHSFEYKDEVLRTARDIGRFAFKYGVKDLSKILYEIVDKWFLEKIDRDVSRDTLRNYLSHIVKIQIALEAIALDEQVTYIGYTKEELSSIHSMLKSLNKNGYINRAYSNPGAVVSNLEENEYYVGLLQYRYGLRVTEAAHIKHSQIDGYTLMIQGKGGYFQYKELTPELSDAIIERMVEGVFKINQNSYRKNLEESARIEGETYHGTHGLRYNYAQNLYFNHYNENVENGMSYIDAHKTALKQTSEEIGHHRAEITMHYLG
jgi:hypothetical protein